MKLFKIITAIVIFALSLLWAYKEKSYEPLIGTIASAAAIVYLLDSSDEGGGGPKFKQKGGKKSTNMQSMGPINNYNVRVPKKK